MSALPAWLAGTRLDLGGEVLVFPAPAVTCSEASTSGLAGSPSRCSTEPSRKPRAATPSMLGAAALRMWLALSADLAFHSATLDVGSKRRRRRRSTGEGAAGDAGEKQRSCMAADRVTRFAADLLDAAADEGARHSRSAKQQLDHWARVGRTVSAYHTASRRRVEAALSGTLPLSCLTPEESLVANAEFDAAIAETVRGTDFGAVLSAAGMATVALDDDGNIVRYAPDGTVTVLG